jgi:nucleotide-binding universal stress UspA family protein
VTLMFVRHVLVPTDFSERSHAAFDYAIGLAEALGAEIDLLHVVAPSLLASRVVDAYLGQPRAQIDDDAMATAERRLRAIAGQPHSGVRIRTMVEFGVVTDVIARVASELPSDLIVMATHARSGAAELVLGSVAHRVVVTAPCPVVTLRAEQRSRR